MNQKDFYNSTKLETCRKCYCPSYPKKSYWCDCSCHS